MVYQMRSPVHCNSLGTLYDGLVDGQEDAKLCDAQVSTSRNGARVQW